MRSPPPRSRFSASAAQAQSEQQKLIADSEKVLSNFLRDPDMGWLQQNLSRSKALIIAPEILKAGFIFGGSGGRALVVARDPGTGKWVGPAFYILATGSIGFQAGSLRVRRRHAGDDQQGLQLAARDVVQDGR